MGILDLGKMIKVFIPAYSIRTFTSWSVESNGCSIGVEVGPLGIKLVADLTDKYNVI